MQKIRKKHSKWKIGKIQWNELIKIKAVIFHLKKRKLMEHWKAEEEHEQHGELS